MCNMKIYSWNVYCYNPRIQEVADTIASLDFDVICLQEVTDELLKLLKALPFHLVSHVDVIRLVRDEKQIRNHVVILSRTPFSNTGTLQFFNFQIPFHTRLFIAGMSLIKWSFVTERGAVYADIPFNGTLLRVFCVHLTLWGAGRRAKEFEAVMGHVQPGTPTVIAGDFNVVEYPPMKLINWLLGAPLKEGMPWYPERHLFEQRFADAGFVNPLRGTTTHPFSRSQLDHILVSSDICASEPRAYTDRHGSDHQLVSVAIS